uniref:RNA-directed DNA polymerase, eukaryota, reverse transcriptase zinc-binding domain protein n=1 Tax=Tanacetum cinerariifolium TaxID=118510 RepID=A0A699IER5_TANCI|nr:RNA-directed DNA polymerase, eukaryota, reverse transcriptase zinc-binding domain protein [Tanacetum cinerariifolium]
MGSEDFISRFNQAYALYLSYIISDHCPTVLVLPKCVQDKRKSFKFANFTTKKYEFMSLVSQLWGGMEEGCKMFKIVKNMKSLKKHLKKLLWKNGDVFENVKKLREYVKEVQQRIDKDPHNNKLRCEEAKILNSYSEKFLGESKDVKKISDIGSLLQNRLCNEDATFMIREVCDEKIKHAMFQIDDNKAPGPDGFSAHFFKNAWSVVGNDICLVVKEFF